MARDRERGQRIKNLRLGMKLSQTAFGSRFNVTRGAIVGWESGAEPDREHYEVLRSMGLASTDEETLQGAQQLSLPFDRLFVIELRIGPQRAGSVDVRARLRELAN
jgi:transcriptional regulator with XRE-family HTH domain